MKIVLNFGVFLSLFCEDEIASHSGQDSHPQQAGLGLGGDGLPSPPVWRVQSVGADLHQNSLSVPVSSP
jgi:hypothetical protein